ncbi:MAG: hypothetical protein JO306_17205, partial [Gemmatimonadetes bacterium]|nr:hypothetical protein [Gemmatimonadota bacterium]
MDAFARENRLNLWLLLRNGASAAAARTVAADPAPAGRSGSEAVVQRVSVIVTAPLCRAPAAGTALEVPAAIVGGSRTAPSGGLAEWIVRPGAEVVWLLEGTSMADHELGALPDSPSLRDFLRGACAGSPPPGLGAVLLALAGAAEALPGAAAPFAALPPVVVDFHAQDQAVRLTISSGVLRVFTGVRLQRAAAARAADALARVTVPALARVAAGGAPAGVLRAAG